MTRSDKAAAPATMVREELRQLSETGKRIADLSDTALGILSPSNELNDLRAAAAFFPALNDDICDSLDRIKRLERIVTDVESQQR